MKSVIEFFEPYRVTPSINLEENSSFHVFCCYPNFDPCFDKFLEKNQKIAKNNENPKNTSLNIFA
jgi:hypothetical protein